MSQAIERPRNPGSAREALARKLAEDTLQQEGGTAEVIERIADEIASATSVEDVLDGGDTVAVEEILDTPLRIEGFVLRPSEMEDSAGAFAVIDVVNLDTGEVMVVTCGGYNVLTALIRIHELDGFPVEPVGFKTAGRALRLYRFKGQTISVPGSEA